MAQIEVRDLTLGYEGVIVSSNINCEINKGDYVCIVGENGTGKSTLMKALLNLKTPISGEIVFGDGLDSKRIGYLPQQTVVQKDFPASVNEIVLSGFLGQHGLNPFYTNEEKNRAKTIMKRLGIYDYRKCCYRDLSGGQQQRVLLSRALCATIDLLIMDEPVAGLDPKVTQELYELIARINKEDKITIVMVSHDIEAAKEYASHILHLDRYPKFWGKKEDYVVAKENVWK